MALVAIVLKKAYHNHYHRNHHHLGVAARHCLGLWHLSSREEEE